MTRVQIHYTHPLKTTHQKWQDIYQRFLVLESELRIKIKNFNNSTIPFVVVAEPETYPERLDLFDK